MTDEPTPDSFALERATRSTMSGSELKVGA